MNKEMNISFDILKAVYLDNAYANIELNKVLKNKTDNINYALITKLVYGVLEKDIYLDYQIAKFIKRDTRSQLVLLFKMGRYIKDNINSIPQYTLVNELVNISKRFGGAHVSGFVNATLKNIINEPEKLPKSGSVEYLSIRYSYPKWIIEQLLKYKDYGFVESLLSYELTTLTAIRILKNIDQFVTLLNEKGVEYKDTPISQVKYVDYNKLLTMPEFTNKYVVQGIPSLVCALSLDVKENSKVLDATAAPGGKSAVIASQNSNIEVTACDLHSHRVILIENYMKKLGLKNVKAVRQDATIFRPEFENAFDYVLCDVPCSGIGVVNKKPDILLNRTLEGLNEIVKTQYAILENNSRYVKSGGVLVYSTCSILPQENNEILKIFLKNHQEFQLTPIDTQGINVENIDNMYTFYPQVSDTEGFFIGRLVKK